MTLIMRKFLWMISICLSLVVQEGVGAGKEEALVDTQDYRVSFMLPIHWASANRCNLAVTIPEGYRSLQKQSSWQNSPLIEFIPKGESDYDWSEIITINKLIGQRVQATDMVNSLKATYEKVKGKIWAEKTSKEASYTYAQLDVSYDSQGKHEVAGCRYYSGPNDCVGVQYALRPKKGESDEEVMAKIHRFFDTNTEIIGCD